MPPKPNRIVPLLVGSALFMDNIDSSILSTALPAVARSLDTSPQHLSLAITSYLLSLAMFIPLSGWMADRFGGRVVFRAAITVFVLGSIACGLSQSLMQLVGARILQGIGGAMMVPVGRLVLLRTVPKSELVGAMTWLTTPALIGPLLGPPLGGLIVTYFSWPYIFFVNVPIGLLILVLAGRFIPDGRETEIRPLDFAGFILMALTLSGIMFGFETVGRDVVPPAAVATLLAIGGTALLLYILHARRTDHPVVDLTLLRIQTFRAAIAGGALIRIGVGALPFLLPLLLQLGFGLSPLISGLLTLTAAIGALLMKLTAAPAIRRFGFRRVMLVTTIISALLLMAPGSFSPSTPYIVILSVLLVGGYFRSLLFTSLNALAYADVPPARMSRATTLASTAQQVAFSLGVGCGALVLHLTLVWSGAPELGADDFGPAFLVIGLVSMLALAFFVPLSPDAGAEMSGRPAKTGRD